MSARGAKHGIIPIFSLNNLLFDLYGKVFGVLKKNIFIKRKATFDGYYHLASVQQISF